MVRVLVVDDSAIVRQILGKELGKREGIEVGLAWHRILSWLAI